MAPPRAVLAAECLVCGTALSGVGGLLLGLTGIKRSSRNPNVCTRCNTHLTDGSLVEVTILFADLCSFTTMTHRLGPEQTHTVVDAYLAEATRLVVAQDGLVDKYIGDAVMALFNVPIARADHAARAVTAGRDLVAAMPGLTERLGQSLQVRVGVATGAVRVGRLGSADLRDYTVLGDAVNRAARLQSQARPGEVMVDAGTFEQVAEAYPKAQPEQLTLKGFPDPVAGYRLVAATQSGAAVDLERGPRTVGRARGLGTFVVSLLGAPCAVGAAVSPGALALAFGAAGGSVAATPSHGLDHAAVRVPLLALALVGAVANLYALGRGRRARRQLPAGAAAVKLTRRERRRERLVLGLSVGALVVMLLEVLGHVFVWRHPWF